MTYNELSVAIQEIIPGAQIDVDFNGQIIIYTNLMEDLETQTPNDPLIPFEEQ